MKTNAPSVDIQELKASIDLIDLFKSYGIDVKQKGTQHECLCPFHCEKTPSLKITPEKKLWNCFGCDAGGDALSFVERIENVSKSEAKKILLQRVPGILPAGTLKKDKPIFSDNDRVLINPNLFRAIFEYGNKTLLKASCPGLSYLKARYLNDPETLRAFGVAFFDGTLRGLLPKNEHAIENLKSYGFLNDKGNPTFYNCVAVPVWKADGELGEAFARGIADDRRLYLKGPHGGVFNGKALTVYDEVIVCEAIFDAMSLYSVGIKNVIATFGTNGWTSDHDTLLSKGKTSKLVFAFDNDEAGNKGVQRLVKQLKESHKKVSCHRLKLPQLSNVKDCNELVIHFYKEGLDKEAIKLTLESLIRSAPQIGLTKERKTELVLIEQSNDDLRFINGSVSYRLRGLHDNASTSLRLVVTAESGEASHTDRFDLYAAKSRHSFAFHVAQKLELPNTKIEEDLSKLIPKLETLLTETGNDSSAEEVPPMTATEEKQANAFLTSKNLLSKVASHLEMIGYVGEQNNKQLTYLIATSRKLKKPLSGIVRSESGAGKSYLMECVAELMPAEHVHYFSRLTPQSLYYMGRDTLQNKLLIVDERNGSEESEYPIRTLQTRRKLTLAVPMKNAKTGNIETQEIEILGPIAYMESTTSTEINPENENRAFEIYLDESPTQTKRIFEAQKEAHVKVSDDIDVNKERIIRLHHNAQRLLEAVKIKIPYAKLLSFPERWTRSRRDIERLLSLVEASAFLHQKQRPRAGAGIVQATLEDYEIAYRLSVASLTHAWADLPRSAQQVLEHIEKFVHNKAEALQVKAEEVVYRRRDVRAFTKLPDHVLKRSMRTLEDLEYVQVKRGRKGGTNFYTLSPFARELAPLAGLTTPQQLKEKWQQPELEITST